MNKVTIISAVTALTLSFAAHASPISYGGGMWTENFGGIGVVDSDSRFTLTGTNVVGNQVAIPGTPGWQGARIGGSGTTNIAIWEDSPGAGGRFYSWGSGTGARSLGSLASGAHIQGFGAAFTNTSTQTFTEFTISYDRQIWHVQGTSTENLYENRLYFSYGFSGGDITNDDFITSTSMTSRTALDAVSPAVNTVTSTTTSTNPDRRVDGTSMEWSDLVSATISGITWEPGQTLFIRWNDFDQTGFDAGLAVANFGLVAIPEPRTYALGVGLLAFAGVYLRRRRISK